MKMLKKMNHPKMVKISFLLVISLVAVSVCILIMQDRALKKYSMDAIIVDQFESSSVIIYTENLHQQEVIRAVASEDTKDYKEFHQNENMIGYKIKIYYSEEILAIFPVSFLISGYELKEKASQKEWEKALEFYDGVYQDTYAAHAKAEEEWENNNK